MSRSLPLRALPDWLVAEIACAPDGEVALLAGHFALFTAGAKALDLLGEVAHLPEGAAEMTAFTRSTWNAACHAVALMRPKRPRLLVLVDDIQYVRPALSDRAASERLGAALAGDYLKRAPTLPEFHARVVREHGIGEDGILRRDDTRWIFSERELRASGAARLRDRLRDDDAASAGLRASADGTRIDVTLPDQPEYCLVHSGHTNCAGGYLELVAQAHARGVRTLIALVPMRCLGPVTVGSELAPRLCNLPGISVVNVAIPDVGTEGNAAVVRIAR